ncbi:hypothetical protein ACHAO5_004972, partial [Verticillium nonalfalfae]
RWDPISKQPTIDAGGVRIEKVTDTGKMNVSEPQSVAEVEASNKSAPTSMTDEESMRKRQTEEWLGEAYESIKPLSEIYGYLIPDSDLVHDTEIEAGLRVLRRVAECMRRRFETYILELGEDSQRGSKKAKKLRDALLTSRDPQRSPHEVMDTLQALHVWLAHIDGGLTALVPVSQAMWYQGFYDAVVKGKRSLSRMQA